MRSRQARASSLESCPPSKIAQNIKYKTFVVKWGERVILGTHANQYYGFYTQLACQKKTLNPKL